MSSSEHQLDIDEGSVYMACIASSDVLTDDNKGRMVQIFAASMGCEYVQQLASCLRMLACGDVCSIIIVIETNKHSFLASLNVV